MAEIKTCIFDLDGVLVDTAKYHYLAWKKLCKELGFDLTEKENESLKGISRSESLEFLLKKGGVTVPDTEKAELMNRKNEWYLEKVDEMNNNAILPGALDFLYTVKESGRRIALGSASKNAVQILQRTGIFEMFDAVIDGTKVTKGKPDPQTFLLAAEETGTPPQKCVVFEDATAGITAANAAGMYSIGVGNAKTLKDANMVIPSFENIRIKMLNRL